MPHVQTVLGPIGPADLGFTLPHEHTQIALWQIPARWDYWQLTRDEPLILEELAAFRSAGGRSLVDLTLPGVGRDPAWLAAVARSSGLNVVMGCGWYRGAYYPPEALVDRRSVDDLADELVREATHGVGDSGVRPGIIGEIGTDKPWVSAQEERVHRAAARAAAGGSAMRSAYVLLPFVSVKRAVAGAAPTSGVHASSKSRAAGTGPSCSVRWKRWPPSGSIFIG